MGRESVATNSPRSGGMDDTEAHAKAEMAVQIYNASEYCAQESINVFLITKNHSLGS